MNLNPEAMAMSNGKKKSNDQLATIDETSLTTVQQLPDYLAEAPTEPIRGSENVRREDIIMPRLQICSKQSPQYDENNEKHLEGLELGDFFNTVTREIYGKQVYAVPLIDLITRGRNREYGEDGMPYCVSFDGVTGEGDPGGACKPCKYAQWTKVKGKEKNQKPECTEAMNFAVLLMPANSKPGEKGVWAVKPRLDTISILGFKSTAYRNGQDWISKIHFRNRDWCSMVFKIVSAPKSDGKNSWHIPVVDNAGWLSLEGYQLSKPCYESISEMYKSGRMRVDQQEAEAGAGG